jgi:hypothetical protein
MAIEGPIKEINQMDMFQILAMSRKSGVLTLDSTQNVGQAGRMMQWYAIILKPKGSPGSGPRGGASGRP